MIIMRPLSYGCTREVIINKIIINYTVAMKEFGHIRVEKGSIQDIAHPLFQDHMKECDFADVFCPKNCGKKLQRKDLKKHLKG